jgi:hypothetical protein
VIEEIRRRGEREDGPIYTYTITSFVSQKS